MDKKNLSRLNDSGNQCIVLRNTRPKTFSKFVDKVMDEFPGTISSKGVPAFPKDPNNPYDVLRNKGFLDISGSKLRTGDCSSDVKLNFYSEESQCGETVKVFMSDHHFKNGKLVYSSTHELIPDTEREFENIARWERKGDSGVKCKTFISKSRRKKLTDILQDSEKQRIVQYYDREARKRLSCGRPLSPVSFCGARNEDHEKYIHVLRSENNHQRAHPLFISKSRKSCPGRVRCLSLNREEPASRYYKKISNFTSSSEISVSSTESCIYASPKRVSKTTSRHDEKGRQIVSLSPQQYKKGYYGQRETTKGYESQEDARRKMKEHSIEKKQLKDRRHINPNKIVRFEDSGRNVQHFDYDMATHKSEKAFGHEIINTPEKITIFRYSPGRSAFTKVRKQETDPHKTTYAEESLEDFLRRTIHERDRTKVECMHYIVNKDALTDYRHKYAGYSSNRSNREAEESGAGKDFEYKRTVNKESKVDCHHERNCEACEIERILGDNS